MSETGQGLLYSPEDVRQAMILLQEGVDYDSIVATSTLGFASLMTQNAEIIRLLTNIASYLEPQPMTQRVVDDSW